MKKLFLFILTCVLSASIWAADTSFTENFSTIGNVATGNSEWTGDLCKWTRFQVARRKQDTIHTASQKQAIWLPISSNGQGKITSEAFEGGVKSISFKYARFGSEYKKNEITGRVLQLRVKVGETEENTPTYTNNNMKVGNGTSAAHETYSHAFNYAANDAQICIENISTATENLTTNGICRIMVADLTITPYLLYRNKDVTIGLKQRDYLNLELINNTGTAAIEYSSLDESVATVGEYGLINPVGAGTTVITAKWGNVTTSYTLHVVDGILAENFSNVGSVKQVQSEAYWQGDLMGWQVLNTRRYNDDTLGLSPRIQAVALRKGTGATYIYTPSTFEGGIKHIAFDWRQWASATSPLTINAYYSASTTNWGDPVATQSEDAVKAATPHVFDKDIDDGTKGNAYLKLEYTSGAGHAVIGAIKITPWLLYITREMTLDTKNGLSITNSDMIDNTTTEADVVYSINPVNEGATINSSTGEVTADNNSINGIYTVTASWRGASTSYTLTITSQIDPQASYPTEIIRLGLGEALPANELTQSGYDGTIEYSSSNTAVATVTNEGVVALAGGVGQTTIKATLPETTNCKADEASYTIYVRDNGATIKEHFKNVMNGTGSIGNKDTVWTGVAFDWKPQGAIRHNSSDTIWGTATKNRSVWIATGASAQGGPGILGSNEEIEGGIKYLSFYWKQWGAESNRTLRLAVYAGDEQKDSMEYKPNGTSTYEKFLFGANEMMKGNKKLYIKNESYTGDSFDPEHITASNSRLIIDTVFITPYLLYTDKTKRMMRIGATDKNEALINNTGSNASYKSSNTTVAEVAADGTVTAKAIGTATITASYQWSENEVVSTWYEVEVLPANYETFSKNETAHTYATGGEESAEEDKTTWYTWLGGIKKSNFDPFVAIIRAPHADENGPAYLRSGVLEDGIKSMTFDWNLVDNESNITWDIRVLVNGREVKQLGNDDLSMTPLPVFAQITIEDINEPGNFVITFENHSTVSGDYPSGKNKARFVIDNIMWENYDGDTKTLSENDYNDGWIRNNTGVQTVTIDRSVLLANEWNTICLPYAISPNDVYPIDKGIREMTDAYLSADGEELTVVLEPFTGNELEAGKPYLVNPTSDVVIGGAENVTLVAEPQSVTFGPMTMHGTFSPFFMKGGDRNTFFVGRKDNTGRNLFYPSVDSYLKGFRAYFTLNLEEGQPAPQRARFVLDQEEVATGIDDVQNDNVQSTKVLRDGQLLIIRDGRTYNAQGARVQ